MTSIDDIADLSVPNRLDMLKSDLAAILAEQQAEHEKRLEGLLQAYQRQIMEAIGGEVSKPSIPAARASEPVRSTQISEEGVVVAEIMSPSTAPSRAWILGKAFPTQRSGSMVAPRKATEEGALGRGFSPQSLKQQRREFKERVQASDETRSFNQRAGRLVRRKWFEGVVCGIVALNGISIGFHADWAMKNPSKLDDEPLAFKVTDWTFSALFLIEFILRVAGEGWYFLAGGNRNRVWNILDLIMVVSILVEEVVKLFLISLPDLTIIRLLRMLRTVRAVRILRVARFLTDLRVLVMGLFLAAKSLLWVIILLLFVMYIFAVCVMEITADNIAAQGGNPSDEILNFIGSLRLTMLTLYKSVQGGIDWGRVSDELSRTGSFVELLFCFYVAFATLCILNIVTGVFVQNATAIAHDDQVDRGLDRLDKRRQWMEEVVELFKQGDVEGTGQIDWTNFKVLATNPSVEACFIKLGIDVETLNLRGLFTLFDHNNDGTIDLEEFAAGILKLHGAARSFDLHILTNLNKQILKATKEVAMRSS